MLNIILKVRSVSVLTDEETKAQDHSAGKGRCCAKKAVRLRLPSLHRRVSTQASGGQRAASTLSARGLTSGWVCSPWAGGGEEPGCGLLGEADVGGQGAGHR